MHQTYPSKCAYVEQKSERVYAPASASVASTLARTSTRRAWPCEAREQQTTSVSDDENEL